MPDHLPSIALPLAWGVHVPRGSADGFHELRDATGKRIAILNPDDVEEPNVDCLAAFMCRACNFHEKLLAVCEAIDDSFDSNGDYRFHTAERSIAELVVLARREIAEAKRDGDG